MKIHYLFPNRFKKIGWILLSLSIGLFLFLFILHRLGSGSDLWAKVFVEIDGGTITLHPTATHKFDEIASVLFIFGAILVAFSKEKLEDEFISKLRLESMVWAIYINYFILLIAIIFIYDFPFYYVLAGNMFTILIFFILRFNWILRKSNFSA